MSDNAISIAGNLTREPVLRFTKAGTAVANLGVAVSNRYMVEGEWKEDTTFFDVVVWKQLAENVAHCLNKGSRVAVTGQMRQRTYDTQSGDKRVVMELLAQDVSVSLKWAVVDGIIRTSGPNAGTRSDLPSEEAADAAEDLEAAA